MIKYEPISYNVGRQHVIVRATGADTSGVCALLEMHHPADCGPPLHWHAHEDEGFYVLAGKYQFWVGDKQLTVVPGDFVMAKREVPHSFRSLGPELGKMLVYFTPAGCERYFEEMSAVPLDDPQRDSKCEALDRKYGITIK
ncbi:MAG: cupin domain-containing protein [Oligoflexia bacterium]|nr:cupin domain-containing protein [Oligoflexia bacterium]